MRTKEFVFTDCVSLYPNLIPIVDFISPHVSDDVGMKCKLILTEFITNIIKHTFGCNNIIRIELDEELISIVKTDNGKPFYLNATEERECMQWPLERDADHGTIVIYQDELCCVWGMLKNHLEIEFFTEDFPVTELKEHESLLEHYGLMILTKSSDKFIYSYDEERKMNIFKSTIELLKSF